MSPIRKIGHAPRTTTLARTIGQLSGPCVGCTGCTGLCAALIDAITVPDLILRKAG